MNEEYQRPELPEHWTVQTEDIHSPKWRAPFVVELSSHYYRRITFGYGDTLDAAYGMALEEARKESTPEKRRAVIREDLEQVDEDTKASLETMESAWHDLKKSMDEDAALRAELAELEEA